MKTNSLMLAACLLFPCLSMIVHAQQSTFTRVFYDPSGAAQAYTVVKTIDQHFLIAGE